MSRSKEGKIDKDNLTTGDVDKNTTSTQPATGNINDRLGAKGQTDYTPGRESMQEFPRRSTSLRERGESFQQNRGSYENRTDYGRTTRYESGTGSRARGSSPYRGSSQSRFSRSQFSERDMEPLSRGGMSQYSPRSEFDRSSYDREPYRRFENQRDEETRRYGSGSYGQSQGFQGSGFARSRSQERDWTDRESRGRNQYDDPYNRESYSGRGQDFETSFDPTRASYGDYDRSERDFENEGRREWGGAHYGRNYLRASDIMTKDITCCSPQTSLREVADKMEDDNVGSIPVIENSRLVGIVTDRDIVCRVLAEGRDTHSAVAADAMSEDLVTCTPDEPVIDAIRKMGEHQIRRIPVCDMNGRLRGIISMADVALEAERNRDLANALEQISQPTPNRSRRR